MDFDVMATEAFLVDLWEDLIFDTNENIKEIFITLPWNFLYMDWHLKDKEL
eukprot:CAMPEP_0201285022 /NCGR_PEP_ID=MMETSP1317-20130820/92277_1 /ASSEMBLY_ACC=CAM_ASM_000770 /TAXON_ID=187299 /ORGANISM="Undescribed Undescribed, Strain Undescribed" /LENGTH=50 /DNA_ID=CAMNT_0047607739 /DNA_START=615 /DNA_END=764 /DNA_ORIENTATION=+